MNWLSIISAVAACLAGAGALMTYFKRSPVDPAASTKLAALEMTLKDVPIALRDEGKLLREELRSTLGAHQQGLEARLATFGQAQTEQLTALRAEASDGRAKLEEAIKINSDAFSNTQATRLSETNQAMKALAERLQKAHADARDQQKLALEGVAGKIQLLTEANDKKQDAIREALTLGLDQLRKDNEAKLEQMRVTVDEKLQGTLDTRLGESFKLVSDRLEQVHKGLGEMQTLATGVGDASTAPPGRTSGSSRRPGLRQGPAEPTIWRSSRASARVPGEDQVSDRSDDDFRSPGLGTPKGQETTRRAAAPP